MKPPSFESPSDNPYIRKSDPEEEPLDTPKKKESKKEKRRDRKHKGDKRHESEKEEKKAKKSVDDDEDDSKKRPKKAVKKERKEEGDEEEALEEKKQKRQSLVERSLNLKKLYEEMPIPRDPRVVARLMIAEHILAIQSQIEQPAPDATPLDELRLLASLDYMGTIADTLENPEAETTPEIKETCETLVQLAQEALDEGDETTIETLVRANNDSTQKPEVESLKEQVHDIDPATSSLPLSGAALLAVLVHTRQRSQQQAFLVDPAAPITPPTTRLNIDPPRPAASPTPSEYTATTPQPSPGDGYSAPTVVHAPRRDTPLITPERRPVTTETPLQYSGHTRTETYSSPSFRQPPESLAAFAVAAAVIHQPASNSSETRREYTPSAISRPHDATYEQPSIDHTPVHASYAYEAPRSSNNPQTPHSLEHNYTPPSHPTPTPRIETVGVGHAPSAPPTAEATPHSSHKIEHLPLVSLLAMAETVSIGHGQRLRSAYEKGAIDKEGLVKILKSHSKHHDFVQEYRQQVVKHRNLVQSSPEFLTPSQPQKDAGTQVSEHTSPEPSTTPKDFQPDTNVTDFMPTMDLPLPKEQPTPIDFFDTPDEKIFHPTWLVPVLLGVLIMAAGILLAFLIFQ